MSGPSLALPGTTSPATNWQAIVMASVVAALVASIGVWSLTRSSHSPSPVSRLTMSNRPTVAIVSGRDTVGPQLAISHDGSKVVYVGRENGTRQLYVRSMDQYGTTPIRGTEGASQPFFSPDDQWIGFFAERQLKKVSLAGGPPATLCEAGAATYGASWVHDEIIFAPGSSGLFRVPAAGGEPREVTALDSEETRHSWPEILPGGKAVIFTSWITSQNNARIALHSLETGTKQILIEGSTFARYASSGHIAFAREDAILAVPFDSERLELTGAPVPVLEGVYAGVRGASEFSLSVTGSLAYISEESAQLSRRKLVWVSREGAEQPLTAALRDFSNPRLSPDGRGLAIAINVPPNIWTFELARETVTRFTFGDVDTRPVWHPDGKQILFTSNRNDRTFNIFSKRTDGSGAIEQLTSGVYRVPTSISSDGETVIFRQVNEATGRDIGMFRLDGNREPIMLLQTPFDEHTGKISPDGRWLAYVSNESGREEIYMQPFPGPGRKWQISTEGGIEPLWARNSKELFYRNGDKMMAVTIDAGPDFTPGKPTLLFEGQYLHGSPEPHTNYDVSLDGERFVMIKTEQSSPTEINVILNWTEELKRLVPTEE
jgi:serine/threonine-protein kinase